MGLGGLVEHFCSGGAAPRLSSLLPSSGDMRESRKAPCTVIYKEPRLKTGICLLQPLPNLGAGRLPPSALRELSLEPSVWEGALGLGVVGERHRNPSPRPLLGVPLHLNAALPEHSSPSLLWPLSGSSL